MMKDDCNKANACEGIPIEDSTDTSVSSKNGDTGKIVTWKSPLDLGMFQKASTVIMNQPKAGFVYGKGFRGIGYYSFETRDAFQILIVRLEAKRQQQIDGIRLVDADIAFYIAFYTSCVSCFPISKTMKKKIAIARKTKSQLEEKVEEWDTFLAQVKAQLLLSGPYVEVTEEQIVEQGGSLRVFQKYAAAKAVSGGAQKADQAFKSCRSTDLPFGNYYDACPIVLADICKAAGCGDRNCGVVQYVGCGGGGGGARGGTSSGCAFGGCGSSGGCGGGGGC